MRRYETNMTTAGMNANAEIYGLRTTYALTFVLIIVTNSILLWRLIFRSKKTRVNILFIILSISDMCVALVSIPVLSLGLFKKKFPLGCKGLVPCEVRILLHYFPYFYSWSLTIVIALDRCLIVTKRQKYQAFITRKRIFIIALALLPLDIGLSFFYLELSLAMRNKVKIAVEMVLISITTLSYFYLLHFVRRKTKKVKPSHYGKDERGKRLTSVIVYLFICQVLLTLPQWIYLFVLIPVRSVNNLTRRRELLLHYRFMIMLRYSNCYTNALIVLYNQYRESKTQRKLKKVLRTFANEVDIETSRSTMSQTEQ